MRSLGQMIQDDLVGDEQVLDEFVEIRRGCDRLCGLQGNAIGRRDSSFAAIAVPPLVHTTDFRF